MLHYVRQVVTNCVCLLFGAEQWVHSEFLELFHWNLLLPAVAEKGAKRAMRVNQNSKAAARQLNNELNYNTDSHYNSL